MKIMETLEFDVTSSEHAQTLDSLGDRLLFSIHESDPESRRHLSSNKAVASEIVHASAQNLGEFHELRVGRTTFTFLNRDDRGACQAEAISHLSLGKTRALARVS